MARLQALWRDEELTEGGSMATIFVAVASAVFSLLA